MFNRPSLSPRRLATGAAQLVFVAAVLAGCGGGGSDSSSTDTATA